MWDKDVVRRLKGVTMKELNIFIDESGDFGVNDKASDLYVVSFVYLSSLDNIEPFLNALKKRLNKL
mgnify:CR=1 FL=1